MEEVITFLLKGQYALLGVIGALIVGGILREQNYIRGIVQLLGLSHVNKKLKLTFLSIVGGILPIEGRSVISAPLLDSLTHDTEKHERQKLGVVDYFATHHYYLWSPLEPAVIIIMTALGLTYTQFLTVTALPLLVYFLFFIFILTKYIHPNAVIFDTPHTEYTRSFLVKSAIAFFVVFGSIGALVFAGLQVKDADKAPLMYWQVLPAAAIFLALLSQTSIKKLFSYVKWDVVAIVAVVILVGNYVKEYYNEMQEFLRSLETGIIPLAIIGAVFSFLLGSSSRYAGITALICKITNTAYLPIVLMGEYVGYLLSPTHKCVAIANRYFHTNVKQMYVLISLLSICMVAAGVITYFVLG